MLFVVYGSNAYELSVVHGAHWMNYYWVTHTHAHSQSAYIEVEMFSIMHIKYGFSISEIDFWVKTRLLEAQRRAKYKPISICIWTLLLSTMKYRVMKQTIDDRSIQSIHMISVSSSSPSSYVRTCRVCIMRLTVMYPFQWWIGKIFSSACNNPLVRSNVLFIDITLAFNLYYPCFWRNGKERTRARAAARIFNVLSRYTWMFSHSHSNTLLCND